MHAVVHDTDTGQSSALVNVRPASPPPFEPPAPFDQASDPAFADFVLVSRADLTATVRLLDRAMPYLGDPIAAATLLERHQAVLRAAS